MDKVQLHNQGGLSGISTLSDKAVSLLGPISRVNMMLDWPIKEEDMIDWARTIERLDPDVTKEELSQVFDGFITGRYEYRKDRGIRNIFEALKKLRNNDLPETYFEIP